MRISQPRTVLFLLCFSLVASRAIPPVFQQSHVPRNQIAHRSGECGFEGNPDLYGLGIRLGVYLQWLSGLIVYLWYPEGRDDITEPYLIFLIAVCIAALVQTAKPESTFAVEILILIFIVFGGFYTVLSIGLRERYRRRIKRVEFNPFYYVASVSLLAGVSTYCSWFWLSGIHVNFQRTPCGSYTFLFAKVSIYNSSVYRFLAACSIYLAIFSDIYYLWLISSGVFVAFKKTFRALRGTDHPECLDLELTKEKLKSLARWLRDAERRVANRAERSPKANAGIDSLAVNLQPVLNVFAFVWSVLGIELTLYWNSISGVYNVNSTGQLIPLVIGCFGFCNLIIKAANTPTMPKLESVSKIPEIRGPKIALEEINRFDYLDLDMTSPKAKFRVEAREGRTLIEEFCRETGLAILKSAKFIGNLATKIGPWSSRNGI